MTAGGSLIAGKSPRDHIDTAPGTDPDTTQDGQLRMLDVLHLGPPAGSLDRM